MASSRFLTILFGALCGAPVGLVGGLLFAWGIALFSQWMNPNDPSAFSVGIICILTAPAGMLGGAILSGYPIHAERQKFIFRILPLTVISVGLCYSYWPQRPPTYRQKQPVVPQPNQEPKEPPARVDKPHQMQT